MGKQLIGLMAKIMPTKKPNVQAKIYMHSYNDRDILMLISGFKLYNELRQKQKHADYN